MPVSHSLKTTGIFYTRKYFSIEKNRNQRFFLLIVCSFIVFSLDFLTWGKRRRRAGRGADNFSFKNCQRQFVIPARTEPIRKGEMGD
jgi:hypothetical protein